MILRARWVLPVLGPPIANGIVQVHQDRIVGVGPADSVDGPVRDLGDVVLMPGLINAHCHLEYTGLCGRVPWRGSFLDWIIQITALKRQCTTADYHQAIGRGLDQAVATGTTSLVNVGGAPLAAVGAGFTPASVFTEGIRRRRRKACAYPMAAEKADGELCGQNSEPALQPWWCAELLDLAWSAESVRLLETALRDPLLGGLAPHALYTVSAPLYRLAAKTARERGLLLTTHAAESIEEDQMWRYSRGPFYERYQRGATHGAVRELADLGVLGPNCLLAHANYITAEEAALVARAQASIAHCPRTHRFFQRPPAPLPLWRQAGINICLGTDSLASNSSLDMFAEMRELAEAWPDLAPAEILAMATVNPARALNSATDLGHIAPGARADLVAVSAAAAADPFEAVLQARAVPFVMIGGKVVHE